MRYNKALAITLVLASTATTAQAAWPFGSDSKAVTTPPTPIASSADPALPLPASEPHPFDSEDDFDINAIPDTIVSSSSPASEPSQTPYTGTEYHFYSFTFRPAQLLVEAILLSSLILYSLISYLGLLSNRSTAKSWFSANEPALRSEFAGVGLGDQLFAEDGGDLFKSYITGRRAVEFGWVEVRTGSGNDLLTWCYRKLRGVLDYGFDDGEKKVTIDLHLPAPEGTPGAKFVSAIADRKVLRTLRQQRWDLATFTTTTEHAGVDPSYIVMTESGDITISLLKDVSTGLLNALRPGAEGLEYLESLVISDVPSKAPGGTEPTFPPNLYHLTLTLRLPSSSSHYPSHTPWIHLLTNLADQLNTRKILLPRSAISKLSSRRSSALVTLSEKAKKEEEKWNPKDVSATTGTKADVNAKGLSSSELRKKVEREKEELRLSKLSQGERIKALEKRRKEDEKEKMKKLAKQQQKK